MKKKDAKRLAKALNTLPMPRDSSADVRWQHFCTTSNPEYWWVTLAFPTDAGRWQPVDADTIDSIASLYAYIKDVVRDY